jgi:hypothetical protein
MYVSHPHGIVDLKTILDRDADPRMKDGTNVGWLNLSS